MSWITPLATCVLCLPGSNFRSWITNDYCPTQPPLLTEPLLEKRIHRLPKSIGSWLTSHDMSRAEKLQTHVHWTLFSQPWQCPWQVLTKMLPIILVLILAAAHSRSETNFGSINIVSSVSDTFCNCITILLWEFQQSQVLRFHHWALD